MESMKSGATAILIILHFAAITFAGNEFDEDEQRCFSYVWAVRVVDGADPASVAHRAGLILTGGEIIPGSGFYKMRDVGRPHVECGEGVDDSDDRLLAIPEVLEANRQAMKSVVSKALYRYKFLDPLWGDAWHLDPMSSSGVTMNIQGAWQRGATGYGVTVVHIDDGMDYRHRDLRFNFDRRASYDIVDDDRDPLPSNGSYHGTAMAGIVAAAANNSYCSAGIAYDARVGAVRFQANDNSPITDVMSSEAISRVADRADVFVIGSGPSDNGRLMRKVGKLEETAQQWATTVGRSGKGSIIVMPAGNGGVRDDSCAFDGDVNSPYTFAINAVGETGSMPRYTENCTALIASAFGSGKYPDRYIVTTSPGDKCERRFSGTSSSAAVAGGVFALVLSANPTLTWRDVQHITVNGVRPKEDLRRDKVEWTANGAGRFYSPSFGFGLMDAEKMVKLAEDWNNVPKQEKCVVVPTSGTRVINNGRLVEVGSTDNATCKMNRLEQARLNFTLRARARGRVSVQLVSPMGTVSEVIPKRPLDYSIIGFDAWTVLSLQFWDEDPRGEWQIRVQDDSTDSPRLLEWSLQLMGFEGEPFKLTTTTTTTVSPTSTMTSASVTNSTNTTAGTEATTTDSAENETSTTIDEMTTTIEDIKETTSAPDTTVESTSVPDTTSTTASTTTTSGSATSTTTTDAEPTSDEYTIAAPSTSTESSSSGALRLQTANWMMALLMGELFPELYWPSDSSSNSDVSDGEPLVVLHQVPARAWPREDPLRA